MTCPVHQSPKVGKAVPQLKQTKVTYKYFNKQ